MSAQIAPKAQAPSKTAADESYAQRNVAYWKRNLAVGVSGSFITLAGLGMLPPILPLYVEQLGASSPSAVMQWSGMAFAASFLGTAVTAPVWGHLTDRYGRKPMLVRAAVGMAIAMALIGIAHSVFQLVLLCLLAGMAGGYASAAAIMVGTQAPRDQSGRALGMLSIGALSGSVVGPLLGGFLSELAGIRDTLFVAGGIMAVAALITVLFTRENFDSALMVRRAGRVDNYPAPMMSRLLISSLLFTTMMVLLANVSIGPILTVYIGQLGVLHDRVARAAGMVMAAAVFGSMLTSTWLGALVDRIGSGKVVTGCLLATATTLLPQAFVTQWWQLALLRGLMGMSMAGLLPAVAKQVSALVAEHWAGKALGYFQSSIYVGQVIGSLMGGEVGAWTGPRGVFFAVVAMLVFCAATHLWINRRSA